MFIYSTFLVYVFSLGYETHSKKTRSGLTGSICGWLHKKALRTSFELSNSHIAAGSR